MSLKLHILGGIPLIVLAGACTAPLDGRLYGVSEASTQLQLAALQGCATQSGLSAGAVAIDTTSKRLRYEENIYRLSVVPGGQVDRATAAQINQCADQSLQKRFGTGRPMVRLADLGSGGQGGTSPVATTTGTAALTVPQTTTTTVRADGATVKRYTYGTPPAAATGVTAPVPPVQIRGRPGAQPVAPPLSCTGTTPVMTGGAIYCPGA